MICEKCEHIRICLDGFHCSSSSSLRDGSVENDLNEFLFDDLGEEVDELFDRSRKLAFD